MYNENNKRLYNKNYKFEVIKYYFSLRCTWYIVLFQVQIYHQMILFKIIKAYLKFNLHLFVHSWYVYNMFIIFAIPNNMSNLTTHNNWLFPLMASKTVNWSSRKTLETMWMTPFVHPMSACSIRARTCPFWM